MAEQNPSPKSRESWHLSKSVPITIILALLGQTIAAVYWAGSFSANMEARVGSLERQNTVVSQLPERMARMETTVNNIDRSLGRIERQLENVRNNHDNGNLQ